MSNVTHGELAYATLSAMDLVGLLGFGVIGATTALSL
jgi:hypothetical protein